MCKYTYKNIGILCGESLGDVVNMLTEHKKRGSRVYADFNGHRFYSETVDMDTAYKEVTGRTKEEFDTDFQELVDRIKREDREHKAKLPELKAELISRGRKVLSKDKWELWERLVPIRLSDMYKGYELTCCLDIIEILNNNEEFEEAEKVMNSQGHSGTSFVLTANMLRMLCDRGEEFTDYIDREERYK